MSRWEKWGRWLDESVKGDLLRLQTSRQHFEQAKHLRRLIEGSAQDEDRLLNWAAQGHVNILSTGLRRQSEISTRVKSLARLLDEIAQHPTDFSWSQYSRGCDADLLSSRRSQFDRVALGDAEIFDPGIAADHRDRLIQLTAPIRAFVNKTIAHAEFDSAPDGIRFSDLDDALDYSLWLLHFYSGHLLAAEQIVYVGSTPWLPAMTRPWITERDLPNPRNPGIQSRDILLRGSQLAINSLSPTAVSSTQ